MLYSIQEVKTEDAVKKTDKVHSVLMVSECCHACAVKNEEGGGSSNILHMDIKGDRCMNNWSQSELRSACT